MAGTRPRSKVKQNQLLTLLPNAVRNRILSDCEEIYLETREVLYEANKPMSGAYFPLDGVVSLISPMENGDQFEVATTGNEGMLGLPLFLGVDQTPLKSFSQVPGSCLRIPTPLFRKHVGREPQFSGVLSRFAEALMIQISQSTACNRAHSMDQRCCRWLLMTHDRVNRDEFQLTQEFLAQMLGVRRATVSEVASKLQDDKLIRYSRGVITVLSRRGLELRTCSCYWVIRNEYNRLLNHANRNGARPGRTP